MFKEVIKYFQEISRPTLIETPVGKMILRDENYSELVSPYKRVICNIDSLVKTVVEEASRRTNKDGKFMTVIFEPNGASFFPDDVTRRDSWVYARRFTDQFEKFREMIGKKLGHLDLLRAIQRLRPSVIDYKSVIRSFQKINLTKEVKVVSAPMVQDGATGGSLQWAVQATSNGTTEKCAVPSEITFTLPVVQGSNVLYSFTAELEIAFEENNGSAKGYFSLICPDVDAVLNGVYEDEVKQFEKSVTEEAKLSSVLILRNF